MILSLFNKNIRLIINTINNKIVLRHINNKIISINILWPIKSSKNPWTYTGSNICIVFLNIKSIQLLIKSDKLKSEKGENSLLLILDVTSLIALFTVLLSACLSASFLNSSKFFSMIDIFSSI